jgi:hypothetical protein
MCILPVQPIPEIIVCTERDAGLFMELLLCGAGEPGLSFSCADECVEGAALPGGVVPAMLSSLVKMVDCRGGCDDRAGASACRRGQTGAAARY